MKSKQVIQRVPIPFCGVVLAVAALGIVLEGRAAWAYPLCGIISLLLLVVVLAKLVLFPDEVVRDLENPVLAGVAGTFLMALLNLSTYLARLSWHMGFVLWVVAFVLFVVLIVRFTVKFARRASVADLTPAYFVIYIGVLAVSTTAPVFGMEPIGLVLALIGFVVTVVLVVVVTLRVARSPTPQPFRPMMCIYSAPPSMCLAAYLSCASDSSLAFATALYVLACVFYLVGLAMLIACLKLPFYPTYAAMTFPFVIAATASLKFSAFLEAAVGSSTFIGTIASVQLVVAVAATLYVLVRYIAYLAK